jgi:hypothetical protein
MVDLLAGLVFMIIVLGLIGANQDTKKYEPLVGSSYTLNGEKLMVVDYSYLNGNFTLSNGVKVCESLIGHYNKNIKAN